MNRSKLFFYNTLSSSIMQLFVMISGFIVPRVMLQYYGSEINGLLSSIMQFIGYFTLVEAGLSGAAIYALYQPLASRNYNLVNSIIVAAKNFYNKSGYLFILLTILLAIVFPLAVKTNTLTPISVSILVLISGFNGALEFLTLSKYRVLLTADQKTYIISLASIIHLISSTLIIIILAKLNTSIVVLKVVSLLSIFLRTLILMLYTKFKYKYLNFKAKPDYSLLNKRYYALYLQILKAIQLGAPIIILTFFIKDLKVVSIYVIFNMVIAGINGLLGIFMSGLAASFGNVIAKNENTILQKSFREFEFFYYSIITLFYSITFITIMPFIRLYTKGITDISYDLPILGFLFVLNGLLFNIKTPEGMLVISAGLYKETIIQSSIQGLIILVFGVIFVNFWGVYGVLIASILSNIYRDIDLLIYIPSKLTKTSIKKSIFRVFNIFLISSIVYTLFYFLHFQVFTIIGLGKLVVIVSFVTLSLILFFGLLFEKSEMRNLVKRFSLIMRR